MLYKNFKGLAISCLGMGCMRLPRISKDSEKIDYEEAEKIIDYAYQKGINYFDTAYPYHGGDSELFIGQALSKYPRESYYLASKFPIWEVKTKDDFERIFEEQLKKCGIEYFDFYLCHAMSKSRHEIYQKWDAYNFLQKKKEEGKIRFLGFSFHDTPEALAEIADFRHWDFAQIQYNYLDTVIQKADEQYEILNERNIPCIVMEPVRGGFLANLAEDAVDVLKEVRPNSSVASWALRYVISRENVFVTLSGMSNMDQIEDNIKTVSDFEYMNDSDEEVVEQVRKIILGKDYIPCTACRYCNECPKQISIPSIFKHTMNIKLTKI